MLHALARFLHHPSKRWLADFHHRSHQIGWEGRTLQQLQMTFWASAVLLLPQDEALLR